MDKIGGRYRVGSKGGWCGVALPVAVRGDIYGSTGAGCAMVAEGGCCRWVGAS